MPIVQSVASSLVSRSAAKRLSRAIPNPVVRQIAIVAATALAPIVVRKLSDMWRGRSVGPRLERTAVRGAHSGLRRLRSA